MIDNEQVFDISVTIPDLPFPVFPQLSPWLRAESAVDPQQQLLPECPSSLATSLDETETENNQVVEAEKEVVVVDDAPLFSLTDFQRVRLRDKEI